MKKIYCSIMTAVLLASCSENEMTMSTIPSKPGTEVDFNLQLSGSGLSTRTVYADEQNNSFPIYWVDGDVVAIASPEAVVKNANYSISVEPGATKQNYASNMTKIGEAGIQWGNSFPQNFYSVYPSSYIDMNDQVVENTIDTSTGQAVATLHVRDTQRQLFELTTYDNGKRVWKGTPVDETGMKNPDAIMYAQKQMIADGDVLLQYVPFTTAFNVTLTGYELGIMAEDPYVVIQEVTIEAPEGVQLCGDFKATFDTNATTAPEVNTDGNKCENPNRIVVPIMIDGTGYLHPEKDDTISFNVFAIPTNDNAVDENWNLHVKTNYFTYTRSLKPTSEGSGKLVPGMVHKLQMPKFTVTDNLSGGTTLSRANWMQRIPRNVYITDLSLPGAWYSRKSEYQGNNDDGGEWTIQQLWDKGVRAFSVETRSYGNRSIFLWGSPNPAGVAVSGTGSNQNGAYVEQAVTRKITPLSEVMGALCDAVSAKNYGYAVLMLSYADGGEGGHREQDYKYWLRGLKVEYDKLTSTQRNAIYNKPINSETTIGDVQGKLIIQVNVASGLPGYNLTEGVDEKDSKRAITKDQYNNDLPALLTYVNRSRKPGTAPISQMHWSNWEDSFLTNTGVTVDDNDDIDQAREALKTLGKDGFYCNYSIANRTYNSEEITTSNGLPTYKGRKQALSRILRNSALSLELGNHNLWSIYAAGGTQAADATTDSTDPTAFAVNMNQWTLDKLNERIAAKEYGPFGNVFCNFIATKATSGTKTVDGNDIVGKILLMNQLFRLSRDEDKPEWPNSTSPAKSAADYSSSLSKDQSGWNAY